MNRQFAFAIEKWYEQNMRDLPWRGTRNPYYIWISEIILQQTRVAQGYDYFVRFVKAFPDVESLAAASEDEVLLLWQGLGYYSRARNLHKAAKRVVELGAFPSTYDTLRTLPGIGDYTAAAIASFAFGEAKAVLDGNVYRVLSRYLGIDTPTDSNAGKKEFHAMADEMLDISQPALYNQAIMDFGAMVCTPHTQCEDCPLCESCTAYRTGRVGDLPVKEKTMQVQKRHLIYIYVRCGDEICLHRRGDNDIWKGLYETVLLEPKDSNDSCSQLMLDLGSAGDMKCLKTGFKHQLTHRLLVSDFYLLECSSKDQILPFLPKDLSYIWVKENDRDAYATSRLVQELYKMVSLTH